MRILVTNDDGIHAPGLACAERIAKALGGEVFVVAPETDQSGLAHSLTMNNPLRLRQIEEKKFALRGTPSDCVIMAVRRLMSAPPDLILSGVTGGANVADDVTYSGTVAGAMEGTLIGIPSIALSQAIDWDEIEPSVPWATSEHFAPEIIAKLMEIGFTEGTLFNLNFPNVAAEKVAGIEVTSQGRLEHGIHIDERRDGRGNPNFWLTYRKRLRERLAGSDLFALEAGRISITPLRIDMTDEAMAEKLRTRFA